MPPLTLVNNLRYERRSAIANPEAKYHRTQAKDRNPFLPEREAYSMHRGRQKHTVGEFGTAFDWQEPEREFDDSKAIEKIRVACVKHLERDGCLIVRGRFGYFMAECKREIIGYDKKGEPIYGRLLARYRAQNYCGPFEALMDGEEFRTGLMVDAVRLLSVDEFWAVGFIHGLDGTDKTLTGRRGDEFEKSKSYLAGFAAGAAIGQEYIRV